MSVPVEEIGRQDLPRGGELQAVLIGIHPRLYIAGDDDVVVLCPDDVKVLHDFIHEVLEVETSKIHLRKTLGGYCECECVERDCSECTEEDVSTTHCHADPEGIISGPAR